MEKLNIVGRENFCANGKSLHVYFPGPMCWNANVWIDGRFCEPGVTNELSVMAI